MIQSIPNHPNYMITSHGKVWSKVRSKWLSPGKQVNDYLFVVLYSGGKHKSHRIHRLVLETFVGPCVKGMCACHNNGNRQDNRLKNLRWDTYSGNFKDKLRHGTNNHGESNTQHKLVDRDIKTIVYLYSTNLFTQQEIANLYKIQQTLVSAIIRKKKWKHIWY